MSFSEQLINAQEQVVQEENLSPKSIGNNKML